MRNIVLLMQTVILMAGFMNAQQLSADKASRDTEAAKEVTKIEKDKIPLLVTSGPAAADWFDSHNLYDSAHQDPDAGVLTKAQVSAELRSGKRKPSSIKQYDHRVRV